MDYDLLSWLVRLERYMSETGNPLVSVIILNYNGREVLETCLDSVFASSYSPFEVIVVDNGSTDGSADIARSRYDFRLLRKEHNVGFCAGNNAGIREAHGEFLVLLNYDTIVHPNWLDELVMGAIRSGASFCQPKILMLNDKRIINSTGIAIHMAGFGILRGGGEVDTGQYDKLKEVCGVHGACIFASKKAIKEVGLLDDNFFYLNEDTDWSWRALLMGLKLVYVPTALVYHKWGHALGSRSATKFYYAERNRMIMVLTNYSYRSLILLLPVFILTEIITIGYCLLHKILHAKILTYADLLKMRRYIIQRRKLIQSRRKIPDRLIVKMLTHKFEHAFLGKVIAPVNTLYRLLHTLIVPFI
jgi:GT2 family glycosyltransferase